jgi:hypothetical protein
VSIVLSPTNEICNVLLISHLPETRMLSKSVVSGSSCLAAVVDKGTDNCFVLPDTVLSCNMQFLLGKGFSYIQVIEAYTIFGKDVNL